MSESEREENEDTESGNEGESAGGEGGEKELQMLSTFFSKETKSSAVRDVRVRETEREG